VKCSAETHRRSRAGGKPARRCRPWRCSMAGCPCAFTPRAGDCSPPRRRIAEEIASGSVRYVMFRAGRAPWCVGKFCSARPFSVLGALLLSARGAWLVGYFRMKIVRAAANGAVHGVVCFPRPGSTRCPSRVGAGHFAVVLRSQPRARCSDFSRSSLCRSSAVFPRG